MPKDTKTLGNNKARACESLGFVHKKGCASVLTQPHPLFFSVYLFNHFQNFGAAAFNEGEVPLTNGQPPFH